MATITTRQELIDYCLRRLGAPTIRINVSEMQLEDRIDDAIQFFQEYHFDGVEDLYLIHTVTQQDIDNKYVPIPEAVLSVTGIIPIFASKSAGFNIFDVGFQMRQSELYNFTNMSLIHYDQMQSYLELMKFEFNATPRIQFNRHQQQLKLNWDWNTEVAVGDKLVIRCYRILDPSQYPAIWNDRFLKMYATALIKRQWGNNLKKFQGIQLPGGVTLDGNQIYSEADEECRKIEEEIQSRYELPVNFFIG